MKLVSGQECPKSGNYNVVDGSGNVVNSVRMKRGNRMPPTQGSNNHFELE
jgi:hypothetical protein